jgi:hypothetical protein
MKSGSSIKVVRKWCSMHANPILRCLDDPEGLNNGYLPRWRSPQVCELANNLILDTIVLSQVLSGAWVTIWG